MGTGIGFEANGENQRMHDDRGPRARLQQPFTPASLLGRHGHGTGAGLARDTGQAVPRSQPPAPE